MEILTLVKAGIKHRKGVFIGFAILTILIVVSSITMLGVSHNSNGAIKRAFETVDKGVMVVSYKYQAFTDELEKKLNDSELVDHIEVNDLIIGTNVACNEIENGNCFFLQKYYDKLPIYNEDQTAFVNYDEKNAKLVKKDLPEKYKLKKGEVYLPYGCKSNFKCKAGDKLTMDLLGKSLELTIKGFVQDPYMGASLIGIKTVFISDEEFEELYSLTTSNIKSEEDIWGAGDLVYIYPSDKADNSSDKFLRDLNLETKFNDMSFIAMTRDSAEHYTGIFVNIIMAVIVGFAILLTVIFLIVCGHNISTEMEIDYTNLGILKAEGFTNLSIRKVYLIEYLLTQLVGIIIGFAIAIPCEKWLSRLFFNISATLPLKQLPILDGCLITIALLLITGIYIYIFTSKIIKTSPVKAITGGKEDYYFSNRLNAPITKRGLGFSLGLRQITSAPKRYISIFIVSAVLVFMIISVELMSTYIESRNALTSMGMPFVDLEFSRKSDDVSWKVSDIEEMIKKHSDIEGRCYKTHQYISINGENIMCVIKAYPDELSSTYKGREVKYDNEVVITEQVANLLDIGIGDTVELGLRKKTEEFVVSGIFQTMNDTGKAISISNGGATRLRVDPTDKYTVDNNSMYGVVLSDATKSEEIAKEIRDKYGDSIEVTVSDFESVMDDLTDVFYLAANGSKLLIYILTFIFSLVTIMMVFSKTFIQERTDIGINRATGFSVGRIRRQFALRFMIIGLISAAFGVLLSRLYSGQMLESVFSMFGIPHMELEYTLMSFVRPVLLFALFYMIFGYLASRKVKKVSARELISE
ncbi:MAG: ABC transporter permease [Lachnospiraceae bacterium]|nr:ABC transporter permease [Lachnospiraceae bacterium]